MAPSGPRISETRPSRVPFGSAPARFGTFLLALTAVSAFAGGAALLASPHGSAFAPLWLLHGSGFPSFLVPGVLLGFIVGGSSALAAALRASSSRYAIDVTLLAGGVLTLFIANEIAMMGSLHALHVVFLSIGLGVLLDGARQALLSDVPRHRFTVLVTASEAIGFCLPALVGIGATAAGIAAPWSALLVVVAGAAEGFLYGLGLAFAMPVPVDRAPFAAATSCAAAICWAIGLGLSGLGEVAMPTGAKIAIVVLACAAALPLMGIAQWSVLRRHAHGRGWWIGLTTLAWIVALPLSFAPSPLVDERTPPRVMISLWVTAGIAMAYVMALVSFQGARRLTPRAHAPDRRSAHSRT